MCSSVEFHAPRVEVHDLDDPGFELLVVRVSNFINMVVL